MRTAPVKRKDVVEMQTLRRRDQLLVGFTLFSMFFGAGNLIFPPQLGAQAGVDTWQAMAGLAVSAVGLPILGVIAVVRSGSLTPVSYTHLDGYKRQSTPGAFRRGI